MGSRGGPFAKRLPESSRPDIVFATANPWSSLLAGKQIAAYFDVPFIADFRDPWRDNPKPPLSKSLGDKTALLEERIITAADGVVANTEELAESFRVRYPIDRSKITTITNGYHESLKSKFASLPGRLENSSSKHGLVELCYYGAIYELRRPTELLLALKQLLDEQVPGSETIRLRFTGGWIATNEQCNSLATELESRSVLSRVAALPHEKYLENLKKSQYLLILQQSFPLQIPAKIYEYMASGRPMIMIGGEGATANLIRNARVGQVCPNNVDSIRQLLTNLLANRGLNELTNTTSVGRVFLMRIFRVSWRTFLMTEWKHTRMLGNLDSALKKRLACTAWMLFLGLSIDANAIDRLVDSFESGDIRQSLWQLDTGENCNIEIVNEPVRNGQLAAQFKAWSKARCELVPHTVRGFMGELKRKFIREPYRQDRWYLFSTYLHEPWQHDDSNEVLAQWHASPDPIIANERGRGPPLALRVTKDYFRISYGWDKAFRSTEKHIAKYTLWYEELETDRWIDWVFHVRWSYETRRIDPDLEKP